MKSAKKAIMPNSPVCDPAAARSALSLARYDIEDRFTVGSDQAAAEGVDVWCPIIQDSPVQRVLAMALEAPGGYSLTRDPDHGNRMLHTRVPGHTVSGFTVRYTVEQRSLRPRLDPGCVGRLETPARFRRELSSDLFVDVNDTTSAPRTRCRRRRTPTGSSV
jgi:hypothetical protein